MSGWGEAPCAPFHGVCHLCGITFGWLAVFSLEHKAALMFTIRFCVDVRFNFPGTPGMESLSTCSAVCKVGGCSLSLPWCLRFHSVGVSFNFSILEAVLCLITNFPAPGVHFTARQ